MKQKYEYKFIRLGEGTFGLKKEAFTYQDVIQKHAEEGWRLVQVFSHGFSRPIYYFEVILEREVAP